VKVKSHPHIRFLPIAHPDTPLSQSGHVPIWSYSNLPPPLSSFYSFKKTNDNKICRHTAEPDNQGKKGFMDVSPLCQFAPWTFRHQDVSPPGRFAPWTFRHLDVSPPRNGRFAPLSGNQKKLNYRAFFNTVL